MAGTGQDAVLTSAQGRGIASASASLPPGSWLARWPRAAGFTPLAGPGAGPPRGALPWSLLTMPTA